MVKFFDLNKKNDEYHKEIHIDLNNIPKHIAIIMDGNGRWAKERNLPRTIGHRAGVEAVRDIVKECSKLNVKYLTLYVFSTENWKRPKDEINVLMKLLVQYLKKELNELNENNVIINYIGDISKLPIPCQEQLIISHEKTKTNTGLILNLALNYGGRSEIVRAFKLMYEDIKSEKLKVEDINEDTVSNYMYTKGMPDPDIIIRPSGEQRLSNFLLWQCAYSEFWTSNVKWPDFKKKHLYKAIFDYQNRDRRFGGLK